MHPKTAHTDHSIHELISECWSPYAYADREVSDADLRSLFEAARWAPSSYNDQPWRHIVARRNDGAAYDRLLECLVEANQAWAKAAPVLALGVASLRFSRNDKPNKAAHHDLGAASAHLGIQATALGLSVHQMIGIDPDKARETYALPDGVEALTALAIGYAAPAEDAPEALGQRDRTPRERRSLSQFVFAAEWEAPALWTHR
jgi:nitroreductase